MPTPSPSSSGKALAGKILRTCLLPVGLGLLCSWGWVRSHPGTEEDASASTAPAGDAASSRDSDRLPPDATSERVLMAAIGGNTAAAKEYLLRELPRLQTGAWNTDMNRILAAVVEDDPGWYESYLSRWLDALPSYATDYDEIADNLSRNLMNTIWSDNRQAMWKAAEASPALRRGLGNLSSFGIAPALRAGALIDQMTSGVDKVHSGPAKEDALQILNPLFKIDDAQIGYLCGPVADMEVQRRLLALAKEGHFKGLIPNEALKTLADLKERQPQDFQALEEGMTAGMKQQIEEWRDPAAITRDSVPPTAGDLRNLPVDDGSIKRWVDAGFPFPIAALVKGDFTVTTSDAATALAQPGYFERHFEELDEQMRRLSPDSVDMETLNGFAGIFIGACERNGSDPGRLIEWRESLDDSGKEDLFHYYASNNPSGALQYATEKMSPGPDRDLLIKAASEELP